VPDRLRVGRLKGGCSQDWLPHNTAEPLFAACLSAGSHCGELVTSIVVRVTGVALRPGPDGLMATVLAIQLFP
jgi:hypothetical protein